MTTNINCKPWYCEEIVKVKKKLNPLNKFKKKKITMYKNILSDVHIADNYKRLNIFDKFTSDEKDLIKTFKYKINFDKTQHDILKIYFKECKFIYDLCVDLWRQYKEITSSWQLLKDVIFRHYYREKSSDDIEIIKDNIIKELKLLKEKYDIENKEVKEKIMEDKKKLREIYKKEMEIYKENIKLFKQGKKTVKMSKPRLGKIDIKQYKLPKKERKKKGKVVKKPAPDDTLKFEIIDFCKNLSNARNQKYDNNTDFELKYKDVSKRQTIYVAKRAIKKNGIFVNSLGDINCNSYKNMYKNHPNKYDSRLTFDKTLNNYYFHLILEDEERIIKNRNEVVALDPGEKIFQTYFSDNEYGKIGDNMRVRISKIQKKIKKLQSILDRKKNKTKETKIIKKNKKTKRRRYGKIIRNKRRIKKRIQQLYNKIKGYVNEVHKKSAKYLCENYENIFIPTFETKPMLSKGKKEKEVERINKIENRTEAEKETKKLMRKSRLSNEVKFILQMQSHYKFKEYLKAVAKRYRTVVHEVNESYTSKTCSGCGHISDKYDNRIKKCIKCKMEIDRDVNGSRNILLKSIIGIKEI